MQQAAKGASSFTANRKIKSATVSAKCFRKIRPFCGPWLFHYDWNPVMSHTPNKMLPCRSGEADERAGFSKVWLTITFLWQQNCESFRKSVASAWPGRRLKLWWSLLWNKNEFSHGNMQPTPLIERPGHCMCLIAVSQNYSSSLPELKISTWDSHLRSGLGQSLNLCCIAVGIKWDYVYKLLFLQS